MISILKRVESGIDAVIQRVSFATLAAMIVIITLQIVFRVAFRALTWSEEVARYLLVWTTFLGATIAYRHGRHIAVSFVVEALPPLGRLIARVIAHLSAIAFFLVVIVYGLQYMSIQGFQVSASLRVPMPIIYSVIPISCAIMLFYAVIDLVDLFLREAE